MAHKAPRDYPDRPVATAFLWVTAISGFDREDPGSPLLGTGPPRADPPPVGPETLDKTILIQRIVEKLSADLALYAKAAGAARAEATHEQSRAENKYDTRGLEASYLARGQARQVAELEASIQQVRTLPRRAFGPADPIDLGAYVETGRRGGTSCYFLAPRAGGTEVTIDGREVLVITPQSPLGRQLLGHRQGDPVKIELAGRTETHRVERVL